MSSKNQSKQKQPQARQKQQVAAQKVKVKRPSPRKLSEAEQYFIALAAQIKAPGESSTQLISPNCAPAQVCCRRFRRVVDVSQANYAKLKVAMFPNLFMPGYIGGAAAVSIPSAGTGPLMLAGNAKSDGTNLSLNTLTTLRANGSSGATEAVIVSIPIADSAASTINAFLANIPASTFMSVSAENISQTPLAQPQLRIYCRIIGGIWVDVTPVAAQVAIPEHKTMYYTFTTPAVPYNAIGFRVEDTTGKDVALRISLAANNMQIVGGVDSAIGPAFEQQIIDHNITNGRVISMSLLATNTTSELYSSGTVNVGRVPNDFNVASAFAPQLAGLPANRRYQGPFRTGGHVTWMPSQLDEMEIDNVSAMQRSLNDAEFIALEIPDWIAGATVRLTFTWLVEFYTPNQLFEKVLTPPRTERWMLVYYALLNSDAAGCNPDHIADKNSFLATLQDGLKRGLGFYQEHKHLINPLAEAIMSALL